MTLEDVKNKIIALARFHRETDVDAEQFHLLDEERTLARLQQEDVWFHIVELEEITGTDFNRRDAVHLYHKTYLGD